MAKINKAHVCVCIYGESHQKHLGSGIFFRRDSKKDMLILTAAHVVKNAIVDSNGKKHKEFPLIIDYVDPTGKYHSIRESFSEAADAAYQVWSHPRYGKNKDYDISIIRIPFAQWMELIPPVYLDDNDPSPNTELVITGFPGSLQKDANDKDYLDEPDENDSPEEQHDKIISIHGKHRASFKGKTNNVDTPESVLFQIIYENMATNGHSEHDAIGGYSGGGIFLEVPDYLKVCGFVSTLPDADTPYKMFYAVKSKVMLTALREYLCKRNEELHQVNLPSLINEWKEQYPKAATVWDTTETHVEEGTVNISKLLNSNVLNLKDYIRINDCDHTECGRCPNFYKGQLLQYQCLEEILKLSEDHIYQKSIIHRDGDTIMKSKEEIHFLFLCSKIELPDFLQRFSEFEEKLPDNTIILWNHQDGLAYSRLYSLKKLKPYRLTDEDDDLDSIYSKKMAMIGIGHIAEGVLVDEFGNKVWNKTEKASLIEMINNAWSI